MGRLRAQDPDLGDNALMAYSILDGEGSETFSISTDSQGRDGLLTVRKVSSTHSYVPAALPNGTLYPFIHSLVMVVGQGEHTSGAQGSHATVLG